MSPERQFWILQTALPAAGLGMAIAGIYFAWPALFDAGLCTLGAAGVAAGTGCLVWRRIVALQRERSFGFGLNVYRGIAAWFVGAALVAAGFALAALGIWHRTGASALAIRDALLARPGIALSAAGFILLLLGIARVIGFPEDTTAADRGAWRFLLRLPDRLGGCILIAIGGAALAAGVYELSVPGAFASAIEAVRRGKLW